MSEERKLGLGTFSEFKFTNKSMGSKAQKAGIVPAPTATDCASQAKDNGQAKIQPNQEGEVTVPPGTPETTTVPVWGKDAETGDTWHGFQINFNTPACTVTVTSQDAASTWGQADKLTVAATGTDPASPPTMVGRPVAIPAPAAPSWCPPA